MWTFDPELWLLVPDEPAAALVGWAFPDRGWIKRVALPGRAPDLELGAALLDAAAAVLSRRGLSWAGLPVGNDDPVYLRDLGDRMGMTEGQTMVVLARSTVEP